jgi:hypothetical protein
VGKKNYVQKTTGGIGSGCEQAQGYESWVHMLTIKLVDSSEFKWKKKKLQGKNHCRYLRWLWASPGLWAVSSQAHKQAVCQLKIQMKKKIYVQETTAGTGSGCGQAEGYELWAHMPTIKLVDSLEFKWKKKKIYKEKTIASTGGGCEQA